MPAAGDIPAALSCGPLFHQEIRLALPGLGERFQPQVFFGIKFDGYGAESVRRAWFFPKASLRIALPAWLIWYKSHVGRMRPFAVAVGGFGGAAPNSNGCAVGAPYLRSCARSYPQAFLSVRCFSNFYSF
jgi:hypothetical protein